jgi:hypothetical protein
MTIQYLVTGREGFSDSRQFHWSDAITKTFGDIFGDLKDEELTEAITNKFHEQCVRDFAEMNDLNTSSLTAFQTTDLEECEAAYEEVHGWNSVDHIFKFEGPVTAQTLFSESWESE